MKKILFLVWFAVLLPPAALAAPVVLKGPYAQDVAEDAVTVMFETSVAAAVTVRHGYTPQAADGQVVSPVGTLHEVRLTGLQKGRSLYYLLEGAEAKQNAYAAGGVNALSGKVNLPPPPARWRFVMMGDTRSGHAMHHEICSRIDAEGPQFVVNSGDLVSDGAVAGDWESYFDIEHEMLLGTVLYPALGNHDAESGKADLYFRHLSPPKTAGSEAYYTVRHGNVWLMVLDSEINVTFLGFTLEQGNWIKAEAAKAAADPSIDHRFVAIHQGPYASKPGRTGNAAMQGLLETFKTNKVTVVFSGHDHNYERGLGSNGLTYVISGGGGAGLYEVGPVGKVIWPPHEVIANRQDYHYVLVTIHGPWALFEAKDRMGAVIDSWTYGTEPQVECAVDADCTGINKPHDACAGRWECKSQACDWICDAPQDAGTPDAGAPDGGVPPDAGAADTGTEDAVGDDAGVDDAGAIADAGASPDDGAIAEDGGTPDAAAADDGGGGSADAGEPVVRRDAGGISEPGAEEAPGGGCSCASLGLR